MEITLATVGRPSARKQAPAEEMLAVYCQRIGRYSRCHRENYPTEDKFFAAVDRGPSRGSDRGTGFSRSQSKAMLILLDSRGQSLSTEKFAAWLGRERDLGSHHIMFAIGPADGWSAAACERGRRPPNMLLSLGPMTLPHSLAAVVLAEQIYRAFTIVEGHPYHVGHI